MPLAVTHVLLTIILVDLYRDYITKHKDYFSLHTVLIAGIAGLLPDIDIPINWLLNSLNVSIEFLKHGQFTHTPFFGLLFLIPAFILLKLDKQKLSRYFFVICIGILIHIFLDIIFGGGAGDGSMLLYPLSTATYKIHLFSSLGLRNLAAGIDAVILIVWLYHEEVKHKIVDFI
tara:strand:- start:80 stop:601 length:522 start_codon:yes stop_codon:yes gene_type:complete